MTTYSELVTQIRDYTETDSNVFTTVIVNDFIEHAELKIFRDIESQNKLQDFLTILYFGAKKEYATAGPFLKIY